MKAKLFINFPDNTVRVINPKGLEIKTVPCPPKVLIQPNTPYKDSTPTFLDVLHESPECTDIPDFTITDEDDNEYSFLGAFFINSNSSSTFLFRNISQGLLFTIPNINFIKDLSINGELVFPVKIIGRVSNMTSLSESTIKPKMVYINATIEDNPFMLINGVFIQDVPLSLLSIGDPVTFAGQGASVDAEVYAQQGYGLGHVGDVIATTHNILLEV